MRASRSAACPVVGYRFGPYELDAGRIELRKFGLRVKLERKPLQLLIALVERAGEVVTRSELQRLLWDEDLFVDFDKGLNVAATKLRATLNDSPEKPSYIETVAGKGYRFVAEVEQVFATAPASASVQPIAQVETPPSLRRLPDALAFPPEREAERPFYIGDIRPSSLRGRKRWRITVVVCVALFAAVIARLGWRRLREPAPAHGGKIMLVVLPFENMSGDSSQEYLSDGMTEELSEQLGNQDSRRLGVIGRTSAMTYKYSHRTIREIGKELGVDYVLEGSVRRSGSEVRVTAQLVQVSDEAHVWAANYDKNLRNLLQLESDLAKDIARQVGVSIAISQAKKPVQQHLPSPEAHEAYRSVVITGTSEPRPVGSRRRTIFGWRSKKILSMPQPMRPLLSAVFLKGKPRPQL